MIFILLIFLICNTISLNYTIIFENDNVKWTLEKPKNEIWGSSMIKKLTKKVRILNKNTEISIATLGVYVKNEDSTCKFLAVEIETNSINSDTIKKNYDKFLNDNDFDPNNIANCKQRTLSKWKSIDLYKNQYFNVLDTIDYDMVKGEILGIKLRNGYLNLILYHDNDWIISDHIQIDDYIECLVFENFVSIKV